MNPGFRTFRAICKASKTDENKREERCYFHLYPVIYVFHPSTGDPGNWYHLHLFFTFSFVYQIFLHLSVKRRLVVDRAPSAKEVDTVDIPAFFGRTL